MKKIFLMMCGLFIAIPAFGTNMCVEDDTVAVVLDASQNGTGGGSSPLSTGGTGEWNTIFAWGRVYGVAACLSANYGAALDEITDNGAIVVGGELNGGYCYCRMTHPAASRWVFRSSYSAAICASNCANNCDNSGVRNSAAFRGSVFGSVAQ